MDWGIMLHCFLEISRFMKEIGWILLAQCLMFSLELAHGGSQGHIITTARTKQLYLPKPFFFVYQIISSQYEFGLD